MTVETYPPHEIEVASTAGFRVGDDVVIDGVRYLIVQITDERRLLIARRKR